MQRQCRVADWTCVQPSSWRKFTDVLATLVIALATSVMISGYWSQQ
jgi:hypothetical protein